MTVEKPRTIVYVGNFTRPWCTEVHVAYALRLVGHLVIEAQENALDWDTLPALVDRHKAEVVLWTRTWPVDNAKAVRALTAVKAGGTVVASFHLDRFHGLDREAQIAQEPFFTATDLLFTPDDGPWSSFGVAHHWLPPGVHEPECHGQPNARRWPFDAVFVGSHPYPHKEWRPIRDALIGTFERAFGHRFAVLPGRGRPPIRGRDLAELYATVPVVLGDSCLVGNPPRYWSDRIPETIGRGGYLIHPTVDGLEELYPAGIALDTYTAGAPEQALELARMALGAEAERAGLIRRQGRELVLGRDTYRHRMLELTAVLEERFELRKPEARAMTVAVRWAGQGGRHRPLTATLEVPALGSVHEALREVWDRDEYAVEPRKIAGRTVVDIGGNVGAFAILAARAGAARVHAYEPDPRNRAVLERNVAANRVGNVVRVHAQAVADGPGRAAIAGEGGGSHVIPTELGGADEVDVIGIDDVLETAAVDGPIALLKLDAEGAEYPILLNVTRLDLVEELVMEWHGPAMPHLAAHLEELAAYNEVTFLELWGAMVARLADHGRVETFGHPSRGGLLRWRRY